MVKVRFAPSPTGDLHLGNLRILVINYLFSICNKGNFILRIDDTDRERSKQQYVTNILRVLKHLNVGYSKMFSQSEKIDRYNSIFSDLVKKQHIYPCYENEEEVEKIQKSKKRRRKAPTFNINDRLYTEDNGNPVYWRFKLPDQMLFKDEIFGEKTYTNTWSDPIIKKSNGDYCYMFCSVIDDIDENITHIIRGSDHFTNSAIQKYLGDIILGQSWEITFFHISILTDHGHKVSKRTLEKNINVFELEPATLFIIFSKLGTGLKSEITNDITKIYMDPYKFHRGSVEMPTEKDIISINKKVLRMSSDEYITQNNINLSIWECFKFNVNRLQELKEINDKILKLDFSKFEFLKEFNNIHNIDEEIMQYRQKYNMDQISFCKHIREQVLGDHSGPQSKDILIMLLQLKDIS